MHALISSKSVAEASQKPFHSPNSFVNRLRHKRYGGQESTTEVGKSRDRTTQGTDTSVSVQSPKSKVHGPRRGGGLRAVSDWLRAWFGEADSVCFRTTGSGSHLKLTEEINVPIFPIERSKKAIEWWKA